MYLGFLLGEKLHDSISVEFTAVSIRVMDSWRVKFYEKWFRTTIDFRQDSLGN